MNCAFRFACSRFTGYHLCRRPLQLGYSKLKILPDLGWLAGWLAGCLPGWLAGWPAGWLAGRLAGLAGWAGFA